MLIAKSPRVLNGSCPHEISFGGNRRIVHSPVLQVKCKLIWRTAEEEAKLAGKRK